MKKTLILIFVLLALPYSCIWAIPAFDGDSITAEQQKTTALDEVTVTAGTIKMTSPGSYRLTPLPKQKKLASNIIEVISNMNVSMLNVNEENLTVTMANGSNCALFINGIAATSEEIKGLLPSMIRYVDLIDHPSDPIFQGSAYVLNFVLHKGGGFSKISVNDKFLNCNYNEGGIFNYLSMGRLTYSVYAGMTNQNLKHGGSSTVETLRRGNPVSSVAPPYEERRITETETYDYRKWSVPVSAKLTYSGRRFIMYQTLGYAYDRVPRTRMGGSVMNPVSSEIPATFFSDYTKRSGNVNWTAMYYIYLPKSFSLNFMTFFDYSHNNTLQSYSTADLAISNRAREDIFKTVVTGIVNKKFSRSHTMSAMLTYIDVASNVDYFQGTGKTRYHSPGGMATLRYYLTKSFVNLYAEAGTEISNFKTRSGDGVEESHTEAMPMLELSASFNLGKSNLTTFLAYRMGGSSFGEFTPVVLRRDEWIYAAGNPDLKNEKRISAGVSWNWMPNQKISLSPYVNLTRWFDRALQTYTPYEEGVLKKSKTMGMIQSVDARMVAAMNLFDGKLALRGSAGIWSQFSTRTHYRHLNAFRGSLSAVAMLGSFRIRGEYSTPSEQLTSYSDCKVKTPSAYSVGASWHKDQWSLGLNVNNFFRTSWKAGSMNLVSEWYDKESTTWGTGYHASVSVNASFNFGYGKKIRPNQELGRSAYGNSAILE